MSQSDDIPPPNKKRKRAWTENEDFVNILNNLAKKYDKGLFVCLEYIPNVGLICNTCNSDKKLRGPWTEYSPVLNFNYSKIKKHSWTDKHINRIEQELKLIHPKLNTNNQEELTSC